MKKKLKKPSIREVNHRDGGMSFYAEGGEFDYVRNQTPNVPTNFEQRMYHTPHIDNEDGSMSSHKMMSWSDENGEHSAPTIVYQNGQLVELTPDEAIDYANKTGEMKTFNSFEESSDYANNGYKTGTPMEMFAPNLEFEPNALYGGRNQYSKGGGIVGNLLSPLNPMSYINTAYLNPYNWGVADYTSKGNKDQAFAAAKKAGEKEYLYGGKRIAVKDSGVKSKEYGYRMMEKKNPEFTNVYKQEMQKKYPQDWEKRYNDFLDLHLKYGNPKVNIGDPNYKNTKLNSVGRPTFTWQKNSMDIYGQWRNPDKNLKNQGLMNEYTSEMIHARQINDLGRKEFERKYGEDLKRNNITVKNGQFQNYSTMYKDPHSIEGAHKHGDEALRNRLFNRNYDLEENTTKSNDRLAVLNKYNTNTFDPYDNQDDLRVVQKALVDQGYKLPNSIKKDGTMDGIYGEETKKALAAYRAKNNSTILEYGGELPEYATAGTVLPRYGSDRNRAQSYSDSLALYNNYMQNLNALRSAYGPDYESNSPLFTPSAPGMGMDTTNISPQLYRASTLRPVGRNLVEDVNTGNIPARQVISSGAIQPVGSHVFESTGILGNTAYRNPYGSVRNNPRTTVDDRPFTSQMGDIYGYSYNNSPKNTTNTVNQYKKPVQPYFYKEPAPIKQGPVVWHEVIGDNKLVVKGPGVKNNSQIMTFKEYDEFAKNNFGKYDFSAQSNSVGKVYKPGKGVIQYANGGELPMYATQGQVGSSLYPTPSLGFQNRVQSFITEEDKRKAEEEARQQTEMSSIRKGQLPVINTTAKAKINASDNTAMKKGQPPSKSAAEVKAENDAILKQRQDYRNEAIKQVEENPFGDYTTAKSENLKNEFRAFPNSPRNVFDDYINPFVHLGKMAGNISNLMVPNNDPNAPVIDVDIPAWLQALGEPVATGMGAAFGANNTKQFVNNLVNPVAGMGVKNSFKKPATDGLQYMKDWYSHPDFIRRYAATGKHDPASMQVNILDALSDYKDKNYLDLIKDKGLLTYLKKFSNTGGVSYGTPDNIYLNRPMYHGKPLDLESVRAHELSHLTNKNSSVYSGKDENALLKPFGYDNASVYTNNFGAGLTKKQLKNKTYYLDPSEIQARMKQARMKYNLTPDDKFTEEMYDAIMAAPKGKMESNFYGMGNYIKDKPGFINLMNNFWGASPLAIPTGIGLGAALYNSKNPSLPQNQFGGGIELSNRMFEEGGEYELTDEEVRDLQNQGYDIELL